ncbi:MAG: PEP-CTERM sorting domain-containing protein [Xenococcaceae cyanobacterium]
MKNLMNKLALAAGVALSLFALDSLKPVLAIQLYFVEDTSNQPPGFYELDINTGAATFISPAPATVVAGQQGLAPSNKPSELFISGPGFQSQGRALGTIDVNDGSTSIFSNIGYEGLAYDPDNNIIYGSRGLPTEPPMFVSIDPSTGSIISTLANPNRDLEGLAYGGNGVIYGLAGTPHPSLAGDLLRYDIATNVWVNLGDINAPGDPNTQPDQIGLAYNPLNGLLYAKWDFDTNLYTINPNTLALNVVGDTGIELGGGLAINTLPVPEPTTIIGTGIALGLGAFSLKRKQKKLA